MLEKRHEVTLIARRDLSVTGVSNVERYDSHEILVETTMGLLLISGGELNIDNLNLEEGLLQVRGLVEKLDYTDAGSPTKERGHIWKKLWR